MTCPRLSAMFCLIHVSLFRAHLCIMQPTTNSAFGVH